MMVRMISIAVRRQWKAISNELPQHQRYVHKLPVVTFTGNFKVQMQFVRYEHTRREIEILSADTVGRHGLEQNCGPNGLYLDA